ncbi:MAG: Wzy polymerase domain-containing protein [Burkholderiaceae bacterium]|nr:Wzy polymerase domain-containing protein [Burkholderiaceae bacterium]
MSFVTLVFAASLALAAWLTPNHYLPWVSYFGEVTMAFALVLAAGGELARSRFARVEFTPLLTATALLAGVPLLQLALGQIPFAGDAWMPFLYLLGAAIAIDLGRRLAAREGAVAVLETLAGLLVAASLVCVGLALYQWLGLEGLGILSIDVPPGHRPFANFGQPNHLATLLFLGLVGTLVLHERGRLNGPVTALCAVFIEFGMSMTGSRTAWLVTAALVLGILLAQRRASLRLSRAGGLALGVAFIGLLVAWQPLNDLLLLSGGRSFVNQVQVGPRLLLWQTAVDAISSRPWFGYGWNQGLVAQAQVVIDHPAGGRLMGNAHTLLLDLMLWNGVPLGAAVFGFLAWWWWRHARTCRDATAFYLLAAISGVLVHALVEYPLSYAYFLLPVALMMGALDQHGGASARWRVAAPWAWVGTAVATALLTITVIDYAKVESSTQVLRFEVARIGTGRIQSVAPDLRVLTQWGAYLRFARMEEPRTDLSADELAWMRAVTERFPYAESQMRSAQAHGLNGRPDVAALELQRLCSLQTARRCKQQLAAWKALVATTSPQLAAVTLPRIP